MNRVSLLIICLLVFSCSATTPQNSQEPQVTNTALDTGVVSINSQVEPLRGCASYTFTAGPTMSTYQATVSEFWIARYEVTFDLWSEVYVWATGDENIDGYITGSEIAGTYYFTNCGQKGSVAAGTGMTNRHPVTKISWRDAIVFCNAYTEYYNEKFDTSMRPVYLFNGEVIRTSSNGTICDNSTIDSGAKGFRLPTKDEWECAARYIDGTIWQSPDWLSGAVGGDSSNATACNAVAIYTTNSGGMTSEVAFLNDNELGCYDMSGNVQEWCYNLYSTNGTARIVRGGTAANNAVALECTRVSSEEPTYISQFTGFRVARNYY